MVAASVYMLCALTSILCAALLFLKFRREKIRFLLWCCLCFFGLAVNNILLFVDVVVLPKVDLSVVRTLPALIGMGILIWGFIWDAV